MSRLIRSHNLGEVLQPRRPDDRASDAEASAQAPVAQPPECPACQESRSALVSAQLQIERLMAQQAELEQRLAEKEDSLCAVQAALDTLQATQAVEKDEASLSATLADMELALPEKQLITLLQACLTNLTDDRAFSGDQVYALVARVIEHVTPVARICLTVSQEDYVLLKPRLQELEDKSGVEHFVLHADESLKRGDVLASTDLGDWDGRLGSRVATLLNRLGEEV